MEMRHTLTGMKIFSQTENRNLKPETHCEKSSSDVDFFSSLMADNLIKNFNFV